MKISIKKTEIHVKNCYNIISKNITKTRSLEKIISRYYKINNQKSKTLMITKTMSTTLMFQHKKIMPVLLLVPKTFAKLITC